MTTYYAKTQEHLANIEAFKEFKKMFSWANFYQVQFYQPSPEKAPWHWMCSVRGLGPYVEMINFWPHLAKVQRVHGKTLVGWDEARDVMREVIDENGFGRSCEEWD